MSDVTKKGKEKSNPMLAISAFIVDKRNLFFLIFGILVVFSLISKNWVKVENSLSAYLPKTSETSRGLALMGEEFVTYGTAEVMVANITYEKAGDLADQIADYDYVSMVQFDDTTDHYNDFSALYSVTFAYPEDDERCLTALADLEEQLSGYDTYVSTDLGDQSSETIASEMQVITVIVAIVVLLVLLFTSDSYMEVPVLVATFLVAAALSDGTNFLLGTISFVSDSVTIVLQLALSVDYAVIFLNRYKNERRDKDTRSADIVALSKSIPEISASSLTTIGGLIAMSFMQFGIGPDMAIVLIKSIFLSLLSVFLLMPGLIMLFAGLMEKTKHRSFVPKIPFVGKFAYRARFVVPILFVFMLAASFWFSNQCPYVYGYSQLTTPKKSEQDKIDALMDSTFSDNNMVALIVPSGDYETEAKLLAALERRSEVVSTTGLADTEAMNGVMLTEKLNAREFSELVSVDKELAELLYAAYAVNDENYAKLMDISQYSVPFIDMFLFLHQEIEDGYVTLDGDMADTVEAAYEKITIAKAQLQGENYSRMLVYLSLPEEGDKTFAFLDEMHEIAKEYYGEDANVLVVGESTSQYDLKKTFSRDNTVVTVVSVLAVLVVLLFTFMSAGMPVLLILVIEGCIWINFSFPTLMKQPVFFMGYLIVSSIQMGANIDYAIVVSSRFQEVKKIMPRREAMIDTMNFAFPTIITSGTMMACAGALIGQLTSEPCICGIGQCLGRGTLISIFTVLFFLPAILLLGDKIIDKTRFDVKLPLPEKTVSENGVIRVDGILNGYVNGRVVGTMHAVIRGDVNAQIISGKMKEKAGEQQELPEIEEKEPEETADPQDNAESREKAENREEGSENEE